jgi:uncharacterized membrane protein YfcA
MKTEYYHYFFRKGNIKEKNIICACIIGEALATIGILVLGAMKRHIPEFIIGFYGFCMIVVFIMIAIIIRNNKKFKKM